MTDVREKVRERISAAAATFSCLDTAAEKGFTKKDEAQEVWRASLDEATDEILALLPLGVEVRELEWSADADGDLSAVTDFYTYYVEQFRDGRWEATTDVGDKLGQFRDPEEAQAACQRDYEQRVRFALRAALPEEPSEEAVVAAWREFSGGSSLKVILRAAYAAEKGRSREGGE